MALRLSALCFNANNPQQLAQFWADALRWNILDTTPDRVRLVATEGAPLDVVILASTDKKQGQDRIHIDMSTTSLQDQKDTVERLIAHGASHLDIGQSPDESHVVLADPEGNEFCVLDPSNTFVDNRRRLGSITCDGSREVGYFWSKALGWPLVWDQDEETAIRAADGTGPFITWGGPPVNPLVANRLHIDVAPSADSSQQAEIDRLVALGARRSSPADKDTDRVVMIDPDGNKFCVLASNEYSK